ncbi:IS3 family transposase [Streptomyces sp. NPDC094472]|uniref:IS3 family transposase n=1 Tax=Streptomyces sp. NPDC094472 TaxID=3155080 RepID=UPI00333439FC
MRDEERKSQIQEVYTSNYRVYGARKFWRQLNRQGHAVARCTVERLMRELGTTGAVRGEKAITTITDPAAGRAPDLLDRDFVAGAPNRCWVADFTHAAAWSGVVYAAFVVDGLPPVITGRPADEADTGAALVSRPLPATGPACAGSTGCHGGPRRVPAPWRPAAARTLPGPRPHHRPPPVCRPG